MATSIFHINDNSTFRAAALEVFRFQARKVPVYGRYLEALKVDPSRVRELRKIPFLPIEFFKSQEIIAREAAARGKEAEPMKAEMVFESSGTTGSTPSRHFVADLSIYRESFLRGFNAVYGSPEDLCILALLPSYLERSSSSLVYMMDHLVRWSSHADSGFYLDQLEDLSRVLARRTDDGHPTLLLGVSFALLDLAAAHPQQLGENVILVETGGMKGRREEMVRGEMHEKLCSAFGLEEIHSEYGMTELLSQAWSEGDGIFECPPWMSVMVRDPNDPLSLVPEGTTGGLNIIDLANRYSCSFIATADLGRRFEDGSFEVLGRFDQAEARGCNLLVT